jgi:hypothetical protein
MGALLVIAAVVTLLLRRKSKRRKSGATNDAFGVHGMPEKDGASAESYPKRIPPQYDAELPSAPAAFEMEPGKSGNHRPQELSA